MSTFRNVTDGDLELHIDGVAVPLAAGEAVTIPDGYDAQVSEQPAFELLSKKDEKASDPVVAPIEPPAEFVAAEESAITTESVEQPAVDEATTEGDN